MTIREELTQRIYLAKFGIRISKEFLSTLFEHPILSLEEISRFGLNFLGVKSKLGNGVLSEIHCHTDTACNDNNALNDGMPLETIVNYCFDNNISILSVTDHRNFATFDYVWNKGVSNYDIDKKDDKRYLTLHKGGKEVIMLRAAEFWTDEGEVNIHGVAEKYPQRRLKLEDAAKISDCNRSFWIINHPILFQGLSKKNINKAIELGADAIEMNSLHTFPLLPSVITARAYSRKIPVIAGSDAHYDHQLGNGLVEFDKEYRENIRTKPIETIKRLIREREYQNRFNYCSPKDLLTIARESIERPFAKPEYDS
jgi:predicted metal-dependent phosphoesterase TrpH